MKDEAKVVREVEMVVILREKEAMKKFSFEKAITVGLRTAILGGTIVSVVYGMATGDYSLAKELAAATIQLLEAAVRVIASPKG